MAVIDLLGASITSLDQIRGSEFSVDLHTPPPPQCFSEDFATKLVMVIRESRSFRSGI